MGLLDWILRMLIKIYVFFAPIILILIAFFPPGFSVMMVANIIIILLFPIVFIFDLLALVIDALLSAIVYFGAQVIKTILGWMGYDTSKVVVEISLAQPFYSFLSAITPRVYTISTANLFSIRAPVEGPISYSPTIWGNYVVYVNMKYLQASVTDALTRLMLLNPIWNFGWFSYLLIPLGVLLLILWIQFFFETVNRLLS